MSRALPIRGAYPPDWKAISDATWAQAGHRCARCKHPYRKGEHGKGEWTLCDEQCVHGGPLGWIMGDGIAVPISSSRTAGAIVASGQQVCAQWRIGTVHHFDGDKSNCRWWNLMALCQRCHLQVQGKVNPENPYFLEHSGWVKPYVAGFYAAKYRNDPEISRSEVMSHLQELLDLERIA